MTSGVFGAAYAGAYDALYADKDYAAETEMLARILDTHAGIRRGRILDLGCGTGSHVIPLAERGFECVGVDVSEAMVARAKEKTARSKAASSIRIMQGDIRNVDAGAGFDAAIMMFAVLGYQPTNRDVLEALRTARRHLKTGGVLVFDVWHAPAVLSVGPSPRIKTARDGDTRIMRWTQSTLNVMENRCRVDFHTLQLRGEKVEQESNESHEMRYFSLPELELFLELAGFGSIVFRSFDRPDAAPSADDWNVIAIATAEGR